MFDGTYLNYLHFADDITLVSHNISELSGMPDQVNRESNRVGLTKLMSTSEETVSVDNIILDNVEKYIYLRHAIKTGKVI